MQPIFSEDGKDAQAQQTVLDTEVVAQPRLEVLLPSVGLSWPQVPSKSSSSSHLFLFKSY